MLIERPSCILKSLYRSAIWRKDSTAKTIYLTFDDGPIPQVTPWVLDVLNNYGIKATFFCVGDNVRKYPEILERIKEEGHRVGNHTFNHIAGFQWDCATYMENVEEADKLIHSNLFRPPHGHMTRSQYNRLKKKYQIVLWDVITRDYNPALKPEKVLKIVKKYARNGSLIVFHDSLKAERNMRYAMPKAIEYLLENGYTFKTL